MSKLSNKNDKETKKEKEPSKNIKINLKHGLLAAVHDSMESIRFHGFKLE
jgi:hypothetical protein